MRFYSSLWLLLFTLHTPHVFAFSDLIDLRGPEGQKVLLLGDFHRAYETIDRHNKAHAEAFFQLVGEVTRRGGDTHQPVNCVYETREELPPDATVALTFGIFRANQRLYSPDVASPGNFTLQAYEPRDPLSDDIGGMFSNIDTLALETLGRIPGPGEQAWNRIAGILIPAVEDYYRRNSLPPLTLAAVFSHYSRSLDRERGAFSGPSPMSALPERQRNLLHSLMANLDRRLAHLRHRVSQLGFTAKSPELFVRVLFKMLSASGYSSTSQILQDDLDFKYADYFFLKKLLLDLQTQPTKAQIYVVGLRHAHTMRNQLVRMGFRVSREVTSTMTMIGEDALIDFKGTEVGGTLIPTLLEIFGQEPAADRETFPILLP